MADLDDEWEKFIQGYRSTNIYWYFPQGKQVNAPDLGEVLAVFAEFNGQRFDGNSVFERLRSKRLTAGSADLPRQQLRVFENLGFAWRDPEGALRITPAGFAFLQPEKRQSIIDHHLWRFQLTNPFSPRSKGVRLFPHVFIVKILLTSEGFISHDEFKLFICRAREPGDGKTVKRQIARWRELSKNSRNTIISRLSGSVLGTIDNNASYAMGLHRSASYMLDDYKDERGHQGLAFRSGARNNLVEKVKQHNAQVEWIRFNNNKESCIAFYGDLETEAKLPDAIDAYLDRSDFSRAIAAYKRLPPRMQTSGSPEEFERSLFLEKDLENYLETRLHLIEHGLVAEGKGRQHPTTVGPIDLFARALNGDLVVIELKKGRAADKVFGQICRYMGCIATEYKAGDAAVRGYIVGSEIDPKLRYASRAVPKGLVRLRRYQRDETHEPAIWIEDAPLELSRL